MDSLYLDLINLLITDYFEIDDSLALFCTSKRFDISKNIYRQILLDAKKGWKKCIRNGNLMACKFLYKRNKIDIHADREYAFRISCENDHLEVAKWLYQLGQESNSPIKINVYNGNNGNYSPIDIHDYNGYDFRSSYENDHLEVANRLSQLKIID